jgi:hypothetical protein
VNLFQLDQFVLASGNTSLFKLECDCLTDDDIKTLAEMVRTMVGPYSSVEGVPTGGLRLAAELEKHKSLTGPHLIVDDVLTTGSSMERIHKAYIARLNELRYHLIPEVKGAVIFARGQCPSWIKAVFQMPEVFWLKPRHR